MKDKPFILLVDDDPNISRLVQLYLEKEGFEVKTADRGATRWPCSEKCLRI